MKIAKFALGLIGLTMAMTNPVVAKPLQLTVRPMTRHYANQRANQPLIFKIENLAQSVHLTTEQAQSSCFLTTEGETRGNGFRIKLFQCSNKAGEPLISEAVSGLVVGTSSDINQFREMTATLEDLEKVTLLLQEQSTQKQQD